MLKINAKDWFSFKGEQVFDINTSTYVDLVVSCTKPVSVSLVDTEGEIVPVWHATSGRFRAQVKGFTKLLLDSPIIAGACLSIDDRQIEEPHSKDKTIPEFEQASNILQRIRQEARRQMGIQREAFAERDIDLPGYEVDEEDDLFEEDLAEAMQREREANEPETSDNIYSDKAASDTETVESEDKK